jgi:UDP-N-acetyl-D-mannosaminuronic acid dehydrogenase
VPEAINTVSVIGLGYVGLPTAAVIANRGLDVIGVDTREATVAAISNGDTPIEEPDLDILVRSAVSSGRLMAISKPRAADVFVIAVPTPFKEGKTPDLSYLEAAVDSIAPVIAKGNLVILESTSPVGTTEQIADWLAAHRFDLSFPGKGSDAPDVHIAHSPERVLPGRVLIELVDNERVIGGITPSCSERAAEFYRLFVKGRIHVTDARTAELVKLAENAYRDTNIAFANEMSLVCDQLGINVWDVILLANRHPRVEILKPGPGVGGHCIAVDPWFIVDSAPELTPLIQTARNVNDRKPETIVHKILEMASGINADAISCLGLAYKADIDDLRESPSVEIVKTLAGTFQGTLCVVEPHIGDLPGELEGFGNVELVSLETGLNRAGVVVLLTDHREFAAVPDQISAGTLTLDTRGAWSKSQTAER